MAFETFESEMDKLIQVFNEQQTVLTRDEMDKLIQVFNEQQTTLTRDAMLQNSLKLREMLDEWKRFAEELEALSD